MLQKYLNKLKEISSFFTKVWYLIQYSLSK